MNFDGNVDENIGFFYENFYENRHDKNKMNL